MCIQKNKRYIYVIKRLICFLSIKFDPRPAQGHNERMCIKAVEAYRVKTVEARRVIETGHSNWMRHYIMLSISLRVAARNESGDGKNFFKLINNRVFGRTMENIRRMS